MSPAADPFVRSRARSLIGRAGLVMLLAAQALVLSVGAQVTPSQAAVVESDSDIKRFRTGLDRDHDND